MLGRQCVDSIVHERFELVSIGPLIRATTISNIQGWTCWHLSEQIKCSGWFYSFEMEFSLVHVVLKSGTRYSASKSEHPPNHCNNGARLALLFRDASEQHIRNALVLSKTDGPSYYLRDVTHFGCNNSLTKEHTAGPRVPTYVHAQ